MRDCRGECVALCPSWAVAGKLPEGKRGRLGVKEMKAHTEYLTFNIPSKMAFVNITPQVQDAVTKSGVKEGLVVCNSMHITSWGRVVFGRSSWVRSHHRGVGSIR